MAHGETDTYPQREARRSTSSNATPFVHYTRPARKLDLHAFRRFRTETLSGTSVPEDLIKLWLGHSKTSITDLYAAGLERDEAWRREWCDRAGLGFSI